ncbi:MAG: cadmium-translocating P-type ATPase [Bacteroidetes bacterium]|uniref:P-type Zn(2+) transporter n=1 Tax=Candidatus Limisoma faecipullorum TaxID=2840854 RepID=A0A9D9IR52_9BACT|nr:cadmium-translocating P-type ATPase [Candidatus Limisoma faecipullorum]
MCCNHCYGKSCDTANPHNYKRWMPAIVSAVLLAAGLSFQYGSDGFAVSQYRWVLFVLAYLPVGLPVMKEAWEEGVYGKDFFNEFLLMTIASIGAFCIGEYPEAVAVMLFYSVGEALQEQAVERAKGSIQALLDVRPETTTVIADDGSSMVKHPSEVLPGMVVEVKTGERLPLDGILLDEHASFDTAALTGESVPRTVEKGGSVLAGMIATASAVRVRVTKPFADSALSRILRMVEEANERKAPAELFIRKFARIYTPVVIALAVLIAAVLPFVADFEFSESLYRGLVFLVVSCPCALVVSIPLSYFAGIGAASRNGILFKGGNYLSEISKLDMVVFDKTGTLTTGHFGVKRIETASGTDEESLLSIIASVEAMSTHPIAKAIVEYCKSKNIKADYAVEAVEESAGGGLKAFTAGRRVVIGNMSFLMQEGAKGLPDFSSEIDTVVVCSIDGEYSGAVFLADEVKPDSKDAVAALYAEGVKKTAILSGDKSAIVADLAKKLRVTQFAGDLLPSGKVDAFRRMMQDADGAVAFVGDGINDAPVLAMSNVGIAMGGLGSDAAIETADVVIQDDKPSKVAKAVRIGRVTKRIVAQNIVFAIAFKVGVLLLGAFGLAGLWEAVFADVGVALLAVLNALRIQWVVGGK